MNRTHTPRPTDLVAVVSFDGEVYANQAVTREGLGKPPSAPRALAATVQQWLGRRQVWIDVRGRQIQGIATARPLASQRAWEIDTLVDAGEAHEGVVTDLLMQASEAAVEAGVSTLLLRMHADAPALTDAMRAGFRRVIDEELWAVPLDARYGNGQDPVDLVIRDVEEADSFALFQLYNRVLPFDARQALAVTFEEWQAVQERRWLGRGGRELVAYEGGRIRAVLQVSSGGQLTLLAEPDFEGAGALHGAAIACVSAARALALQPVCMGTPTSMLRAHGYQPGEQYVLLARRTLRPLMETIPSTAGRTVPTRG